MSLYSLIHDGYKLSTEYKFKLTAQLIEGVHEMHERGILHLDIKPDNVLIGCDGGVRIADLGTSMRRDSAVGHLRGTYSYLAPELLQEECFPVAFPFDERIDAFELGITILELWLGKVPHARPEMMEYEQW